MDDALDAWFVREVLVHEDALVGFLRRNWRNQDEVPDLRQEVYARVYEAATRQRPRSPKSFLFTTARHLLVDHARRKRIVSITAVGDLERLNVLEDDRTPDRWAGGREALRRLAVAMDRLPDRCREVMWLRRIVDLPQKEIAQRLGISEGTVEKHIARGARLIAGYFYASDHEGAMQEPAAHACDRERERS